MGIRCLAQETQTGALYQPRGVGWGGRREGGTNGRHFVHLWLIRLEVSQETAQFCKAVIPQLKLYKIKWVEWSFYLYWSIVDWASLIAWSVKNLPAVQACSAGRDPTFGPWVGKLPWRRKWQPTPVFLPGESHGQRSLAGYSPWGCKSWTLLSE